MKSDTEAHSSCVDIASTMLKILSFLLLTTVLGASADDFNGKERPATGEPGGVIVHLFDWKFTDIAKECEDFLGPNGFAGVEVSPVHENLVAKNRPWYERLLQQIPYMETIETVVPWFLQAITYTPWYEKYQPVSYKIASRSGNEEEFINMVERCNKAGIKVYVDVIINHMTRVYTQREIGTGGSPADTVKMNYPAVPYTEDDFNQPSCPIVDDDPKHVRECELKGLHDLNQTNPCVREKMRKYLNKLISIGVAGFRVDSVKYMWPEDLMKLFGHLDYLNCGKGFVCDTKPYVFQDFNNFENNRKIKPQHYFDIGRVMDYTYTYQLSQAFRMKTSLENLQNLGKGDDDIGSVNSVVFIDNPNTQRGKDYRTSEILSYKEPDLYKMATAFMLAWPHGQPRLMSSYMFKDANQGPPTKAGTNDIDDVKIRDGECINGWICEHRWREIRQMVEFRNVVGDEQVSHFWTQGDYQMSFNRGRKGFIVFNVDRRKTLERKFQTALTEGEYCDIMTGELRDNQCTGRSVKVDASGLVDISIPPSAANRVIAIHANAKVEKK